MKNVYAFGLNENFIERLADVVEQDFLASGTHLSRIAFVFNGKRPAYFLKKELSRRWGRAFLAPRCFSLDEFVNHLVERQQPRPLVSGLDACLALYRAAQETAPEILAGRETFSRFLPWAREILSFIEQLDLELVDSKKLENIQQAAGIGYDVPENINQLLRHVIKLRQQMNRYLDEQGLDTPGQRYAKAGALAHGGGLAGFDFVFFCNFFYVHAAEQLLIQEVMAAKSGVLVFQGDEREWPVLADTGRALGVSIRPTSSTSSACQLHLHEGLDTHSQAGIVARIMKNNQEPQKTVIVLPDTQTLVPLLSELDVAYEDCNVSMGYPLRRSALFNLFKAILDAQVSRRKNEYYVKDYVQALSHPFIKNLRLEDEDASLTRILLHKVEEALRGTIENPLAGSLFVRPEDIEGLDELYAAIAELAPGAQVKRVQLQAMLTRIHQLVFKGWEEVRCLADLAARAADILDMLQEKSFLANYPLNTQAAQRVYQLLDELRASRCGQEIFPAEELFKIFEGSLSQEKLAFSGTPLQGLQILGVFETRALNFEQVIICDANEGVLPDIRIYEPLIPREVMLQLGLNRLEKEEEIQRYHVMRLLAGAKQAHLVYNASEDKERSRFIEELVWKGQQQAASLDYAEPQRAGFAIKTLPLKRSIPKTRAIGEFLKTVTFSATSIDVYTRCPLRFYYHYVLGLREQEELGEEPEAAQIGTFVHELLEEAYKPLIGRPLAITPAFRKNFDELFSRRFSEFFGRRMKSDAFLLESILRVRLAAFLDAEEKRPGVGIISLEQQFNATLECAAGKYAVTARLDRIERHAAGGVVIIDYKTGSHDAKPKGLKTLGAMDLASRESIKRAVVSFQLPLYHWLVARHYPDTEVRAALYLLRDAQLSQFPYAKTPQEREQMLALCQDALQAIIAEIMDPETVFSADESEPAYCDICPFYNACR